MAAVAVPAASPPLFEALRWTVPGSEIAALTTQPAACLTGNPRDAPDGQVQAGHALFNSPALLGGQAAKAGLSCASCHAGGRDNRHFQMTGVSARPGTADVTHSFFSAARSNGRFDPVTIPDLAMPGKISRDPEAAALEPFIRTLIVEEFSGQQPSPAMLAALAGYVRAIRLCPGNPDTPAPRGLNDQLQLVNHALAGAAAMAAHGDQLATRALIAATRYQLGLISERFAGPQLARERTLLLGASRDLNSHAMLVADPEKLASAIKAWRSAFAQQVEPQLKRNLRRSLYNPANLGFVAPQRDNR